MLTTAPSTSSPASAPPPKHTRALHSDTCRKFAISLVDQHRGSEHGLRTVDTSLSGCWAGSASSATCISDKPAKFETESPAWLAVARRRPSVPVLCRGGSGGGAEESRSGGEG